MTIAESPNQNNCRAKRWLLAGVSAARFVDGVWLLTRVTSKPQCISSTVAALTVFACVLQSQQVVTDSSTQPGTPANAENQGTTQVESKRILGIIPNYRTSPSLIDRKPLTSGEKFKMATNDSRDRGTFIMAGIFAGQAQCTNPNRLFGQRAADTTGRHFPTLSLPII
jgi:hypothetical protein